MADEEVYRRVNIPTRALGGYIYDFWLARRAKMAATFPPTKTENVSSQLVITALENEARIISSDTLPDRARLSPKRDPEIFSP